MSGPYESFGDVGVAFIVDAESAMIDEPCPGPFDNPASGEHLETGALDAVDDLDVDIVRVVAVVDEYSFETSVDPEFGEPTRFGRCLVDEVDPAEVVGHAGGDHGDGDEEAKGVDQAEDLAAGDLFPSVKPPCWAGYSRGALDAAGVHHSTRRVGVAPFPFTDELPQAIADPLPGPVTGPRHVIAVNRVPMWVMAGERTPLTAGSGNVQNRIDDLSFRPLDRPTNLPFARERRHEILDQFPLFIRQIRRDLPPRTRNANR